MITTTQHKLLLILSNALFSTGNVADIEVAEIEPIIREACAQTVFPMAAGEIGQHSEALKMQMNAMVAQNFRINYEHKNVHDLLVGNDIPYVILKGCASAAYYVNPILRTMGDVDVLVHECDFARVGKLMESIGFIPEDDSGGIHVAYRRGDSTWELHRSVNGIPGGDCGERVREYLADIIDSAVDCETPCGIIRIPDPFHHGLVLLLHTASHLTDEGIGLRHLCDWAAFADKADVSQWQKELQNCGLWDFARVLTLVCTDYLGLPVKKWAGEADTELLEGLAEDILTGGNFGHKDKDRSGQIKYIKNRGEATVDGKSAIRQVWDTIGKKAQIQDKTRFGVMLDYGAMVLCGERKADSGKTLSAASQRKKLYTQLHLFEPEKDRLQSIR